MIDWVSKYLRELGDREKLELLDDWESASRTSVISWLMASS